MCTGAAPQCPQAGSRPPLPCRQPSTSLSLYLKHECPSFPNRTVTTTVKSFMPERILLGTTLGSWSLHRPANRPGEGRDPRSFLSSLRAQGCEIRSPCYSPPSSSSVSNIGRQLSPGTAPVCPPPQPSQAPCTYLVPRGQAQPAQAIPHVSSRSRLGAVLLSLSSLWGLGLGSPAPTQAQGPPLGSLLGHGPLGAHIPAAAPKSHLG